MRVSILPVAQALRNLKMLSVRLPSSMQLPVQTQPASTPSFHQASVVRDQDQKQVEPWRQGDGLPAGGGDVASIGLNRSNW
jgi:hypothetical protein